MFKSQTSSHPLQTTSQRLFAGSNNLQNSQSHSIPVPSPILGIPLINSLQTSSTELKLLQINLGRTIAAANILQRSIAKIQPDLLLAQEPYISKNEIQGIPANWNLYSSINQKAIIVIPPGNISPIIIDKRETAIAIKIHTEDFPLVLISAYSSPAGNIERTLEDMQTILAAAKDDNVMICADLNGHHSLWGYNNEDTRGKKILDFALANNLYITNPRDAPPTLINYNGTHGWPDLTLCTHNLIPKVSSWEVLEDVSNSDHSYIKITLASRLTSYKLKRYKTLHGNHKKFLNIIKPKIAVLEDKIVSCDTPEYLNQITQELQKEIISACNKAFKIKSHNVISNPTWWTSRLEADKNKLQALRRRAQRTIDPIARKTRFQQWKRERTLHMRQVRKGKIDGWKKTCSSAKDPYGKHYKAAFRKTVLPTQLSVLEDIDPSGSQLRIAQDILEKLFPFPTYSIRQLLPSPSIRDDIPFTISEVKSVVKSLPNGKAPGIDGIDNLVLKSLNKEFPNLFCTFFNKCLDLRTFPDAFKISNIVLFQKVGKNPKLSSSYRPIALLPTIGKTLEKLLTQRLMFHLESENKLNQNQHGFRTGKSVDTAISSLLKRIHQGRREKNHVLALSLDIKGAFDNILHQAIVNNLSKAEVPSNLRLIFENILKNREVLFSTQEGTVSRNQEKGCPQGSCSGPVLWNIVVNDLLNKSFPPNCHIQAYADDIVLVTKSPTKEGLKLLTNNATSIIINWADENSLTISHEKSNFLLFSKLAAAPPVSWKNHRIKRSHSIKFLGLYIDDKLNWNTQLRSLSQKAQRLHQNFMKIVGTTWGIKRSQRILLYKTVIERVFAHGCSAWCSDPTVKMARKLDSIQRPFLLAISGAYRTTSTAALQVLLGIPPFSLKLKQEGILTNIFRLRHPVPTFDFSVEDFEESITSWTTHPSLYLKNEQVVLTDGGANLPREALYTDGSKTEQGVGAAFCRISQNQVTECWSSKLNPESTVFQAELYALQKAVQLATKNPNTKIIIFSDSKASIQAVSNPRSRNKMAREIFASLLENPEIQLNWIKAHVGYQGNEKADQLAKEAADSISLPQFLHLSKSHLKSQLTNIY
ncbi:Putative protein in type-1 retrotransposable element R1DM [Araneus ventricosus]|uniref:Retrovirus-related Pol polyprotein from type-1 retrotransposable element R1 n=1 Tax=Araneus ventricosus TaxID=182803 RepID=A0A4Y2JFB2_ARAVE|nr:Putative protein in type-1 retrotransposable element R1DM [Araneus ventricosus]